VGYSGNADHYDMKGEWPKFEVKGLEGSKAYVVAKDMSLEGDGKRVRDDLYDGLATFKIASLSFMGGDNDKVEISNIEYVVGVDSKDDFTNAGLKTGTGTWKSQQLATLGLELKEFHFDFGFRHLHSETLAKVMTGMKEIYTKPLPIETDAQKVMFAPFKEQGTELLKYDPEFGIDRLGISTAEGDGYLKGVVTLKGATAEDFAAGSMGLIGKLHADFTVDVAEKLVQKFPNGSTAAGAAVDSGYVERKGDRLVCKILFKDGQLTVNGKPQAIPGLGGPPPMPPEGAPPPAE
jgi:uncharacterized protein YdgA (DUF945 family)